MMMGDLRTYILADAATAAVVGGSDGRLYPPPLPQKPTYPAITASLVSAIRHHASPSGPLGVVNARVQVDAWSPSITAARNLAELIRLRIDGFRGVMGSTTVQRIASDGDREIFESNIDPTVYRVVRDYIVMFEEATS